MAAPEIHKNGAVVFQFDAKDQAGVVISLVGKTMEVIFTDPCGLVVTQTGTVTNAPGTDGLYQYKTLSNVDETLGDLNLDGKWQVQGHVIESGTVRNKTDVQKFTVKPNL